MLTVEDLLKLWDFSRPEESEQRFLKSQVGADPATHAQLATQIARTYGLRKDFEHARQILTAIPAREKLPVAVHAWYWLEWGRSLVSVAHDSAAINEATYAEARSAYATSIKLAEDCGLDFVAVDAMHMMVMVDREPGQQFDWNARTIARIERSSDVTVRRWLGPLHNNQGYALHLAGRFEEALQEFELSRKAYLERGDGANVRIANWMTAWTYRVMGRAADAMTLQLQNEQENAAAGTPDVYVFEELETLYHEAGQREQAERYRALKEVK